MIGGAAIGLWALTRKEKEEVEAVLSQRLQAQGSSLDQLKEQVHKPSIALIFIYDIAPFSRGA